MSVELIIEVVGIGGAGKSTLVDALARRLNAGARKTDAFPADTHARATAVGRALGRRAEAAFRASAIAVALLHEAAALPPGTVVYDRFLEGALMYFAVKDCWPLPDDVVARLPRSGAVLLVDVAVDTGLARRRRAATEGWVVLDGEDPPDQVLDQAIRAVTELSAPGH